MCWIVFDYISGCREYHSQCPTAQDVRNIVNLHLSEKEKLDNTLPSSIVIGPFHVSVEGVKQNLSKKRKALATSMLDLLAKNLHLQVENVSFTVLWLVLHLSLYFGGHHCREFGIASFFTYTSGWHTRDWWPDFQRCYALTIAINSNGSFERSAPLKTRT